MVYGNKYMDVNDPNGFKVDVILFVADDECMNKLHNYAENRFHSMNDDYRRYIATIDSGRKFADNTTASSPMVMSLVSIISACRRRFRFPMKVAEQNIEITCL